MKTIHKIKVISQRFSLADWLPRKSAQLTQRATKKVRKADTRRYVRSIAPHFVSVLISLIG